MQPGETVPPHGTPPPAPTPEQTAPSEQPQATASPPQPTPPEQASWYHAEDPASAEAPFPISDMPPAAELPDADEAPGVTWTASEFIAHDKPSLWYGGFILAVGLVGGITYLISREIIMVVAVVAAMASFGIMATRRPRVLEYQLDAHGVQIGPKLYHYGEFRSYSLLQIGAIHAIDLIPVQRFKPLITIYFPPDQEEPILSKLGESLPLEQRSVDLVDRLMHRLRF
jgi:hypothetical protein